MMRKAIYELICERIIFDNHVEWHIGVTDFTSIVYLDNDTFKVITDYKEGVYSYHIEIVNIGSIYITNKEYDKLAELLHKFAKEVEHA